jgi:prepilin-type N-terminal cleavage/methylation domain-containing protein
MFMRNPGHQPAQSQVRPRGFTLIELLLSVTIMTVIIVALYAVFDHTQKALRNSVSQVDVLESGRAAMDLMTRELEQMSASNEPNVANLFVQFSVARPFFQTLPGDKLRTNFLQDFFFLSRMNNQWSASGYMVVPLRDGAGNSLSTVGTLVRFNTNSPTAGAANQVLSTFLSNAATNILLQPVIEGVIHMSLRIYDRNGLKFSDLPRRYFRSDALPGYVELELGILEPQIIAQFRSMPNSNVATNFLAKHAGQVHLFRQRIPIRTAFQ